MKTLVFADHDNHALKDGTLAVVTAAAQLGDVHVLVAGHACEAVANQAAQVAGVSLVLLAEDPAYEHELAENVAPLIVNLMADRDAFLAPATSTGKNVAPRVARGLVEYDAQDVARVLGLRTEAQAEVLGYAPRSALVHRDHLVLVG